MDERTRTSETSNKKRRMLLVNAEQSGGDGRGKRCVMREGVTNVRHSREKEVGYITSPIRLNQRRRKR